MQTALSATTETKEVATAVVQEQWGDSGWVFYPQQDSVLGDIRPIGAKPVAELLAEAEREPLCVAINTLGWMKATVTYPLRKCLSGEHGLFVKKGFPFVHAAEEPTLVVSECTRTFADSGIDAVLYINLEHRTDRKTELLGELERAGVPADRIHRIDAIRNKDFGNLGCSQSHTKAVEFAMEHPEWKRVAILEDDFVIRNPATIWTQLGTVLADKNPDVFLLGHNPIDFQFERTATPQIVKVLATTQRSGYVVAASYMRTLRDNFQTATDLMMAKGNIANLHGDVIWKQLMPAATWLSYEPVLGYQRNGYSDCEKSNLNFQY
jgi:GR25 family glycosyltransferase involved in LPS biosynthesis